MSIGSSFKKTIKVVKKSKENIDRVQSKIFSEREDKKLVDISGKLSKVFRKSSAKECGCKDAKPIKKKERYFDEETQTDYEDTKVVCSKCGGKYYEYYDYSFLALLMGKKRSGKTTFAFMMAWILYNIDPYRRIVLWKCPTKLINILHNINWCTKYETLCSRALGIDRWSNVTSPCLKNSPEVDKVIWTKTKKGDEKIINMNFISKIDKRKIERKYPFYQYKSYYARICNELDDNIYPPNLDDGSRNCDSYCANCPHFQKGFKQFVKVSRTEDLEFGDIVVMDEANISSNAKLALTVAMRDMEMMMSVLAHKRIIWFALFQRWAIIKALRELAEIVIYKRIQKNTIQWNDKDKYLIRNIDRISKLGKDESVLVSGWHMFDDEGLIYNLVPEWYTDEISMSYSSETGYMSKRAEMEETLRHANEMADYLVSNNFILNGKNDYRNAEWVLYNHPVYQSYLNKRTILTHVWNAYAHMVLDTSIDMNDVNDPNAVTGEIPNQLFLDSNVTEKEMRIFEKVCLENRSMNSFADDEEFNEPRQRVREIIRKVGTFLLRRLNSNINNETGDDAERFVKWLSWNRGGWGARLVGSGGHRGIVPSADNLEIDSGGKLNVIQVKQVSHDKFTSQPAVANSEFLVMERLRDIGNNTKIICPYCAEIIKGKNLGGLIRLGNVQLKVLRRVAKYDEGHNVVTVNLNPDDNKKKIWVNLNNNKVKRISPEIDKIHNEKMLDFLNDPDVVYIRKNDKKDEDKKDENNLNDDEDILIVNEDEYESFDIDLNDIIDEFENTYGDIDSFDDDES